MAKVDEGRCGRGSLERGIPGWRANPKLMHMGISEGLRHSLESYLERSAAELDDRGAEINARAEELAAHAEELELEAARIKDLEVDLAERERRLGELRSTQENAEETLSRVHATLDERAKQLGEKEDELRRREEALAGAVAELERRERSLEERRALFSDLERNTSFLRRPEPGLG